MLHQASSLPCMLHSCTQTWVLYLLWSVPIDIASSLELALQALPGAKAATTLTWPEACRDRLLKLPAVMNVLDFSVVHPAAFTYLQVARTLCCVAAIRNAATSVWYGIIDPNNHTFVPSLVESYGWLGNPAMEWIHILHVIGTAGGTVEKVELWPMRWGYVVFEGAKATVSCTDIALMLWGCLWGCVHRKNNCSKSRLFLRGIFHCNPSSPVSVVGLLLFGYCLLSSAPYHILHAVTYTDFHRTLQGPAQFCLMFFKFEIFLFV